MDSDAIGDLRRTRVTVLEAASITGNARGTGNQLASLKSTCEGFNSRKRRNEVLKTSCVEGIVRLAHTGTVPSVIT